MTMRADPAEMQVRPFEAADEEAVVALCRACGLTRPWRRLGFAPDDAVPLGKRLIPDAPGA